MATVQAQPARVTASQRPTRYLPREHGATAMLLTPIVSVAILARSWRWSELAVLIAAFAAISAKDPAVVVMRQWFVWKQWHPETRTAIRWLLGWTILLVGSGVALVLTWPIRMLFAMALGLAAFAGFAIFVNVKNRQRSTLFQIASAAALTSTSLATCIAATGSIAPWCWWFWLLITLQASAGILVVHARLDARIALRGTRIMGEQFRRAAQVTLAVLACAGISALVMGHVCVASALMLASAAYAYDLVRQKDPTNLQMPLTRVGQQALVLSSIYSVLLIVGLW